MLAGIFLIRSNRFLRLNINTDKMNRAAVRDHLKSESYSVNKQQSTADKLQRQLSELERRVEKYFDDLDNFEEMCKDAQAKMKRFQLRAEAEKEIVKKDAEIQAKLFSQMKEMQKKLKRMEVKDDHETPPEEKTPDASTINALRYTTSARVCRFIKIGCTLVLDAVGAYALFKMTQPYLF